MCTNCSTAYKTTLKTAIACNPTFQAICDFNVSHFPADGYAKYYRSLCNGTAILYTHEQLNTYLASYSDMHKYKLDDAFKRLFTVENFSNQQIEVIDWGCGQAFASCVLIDFIREHNLNIQLTKIHLIEPSTAALARGSEHLDAIFQTRPKPEVVCINKKADELTQSDLKTKNDRIKLHLFSNLLDISTLDIERVAEIIKESQAGTNYLVCISPLQAMRLQSFYEKFANAQLLSFENTPMLGSVFRPSAMRKVQHLISRIEYIFKTIN